MFGTLTVEENLLIGASRRGDRARCGQDSIACSIISARCGERRAIPAGRLSGGEQQMLAIARALMTRAPMILVDEPSLGLAPKIVDQIYEILLDLRVREKLTLLINEQSSHRILKHADRIYVLACRRRSVARTRPRIWRDGQAIKRPILASTRSRRRPCHQEIAM